MRFSEQTKLTQFDQEYSSNQKRRGSLSPEIPYTFQKIPSLRNGKNNPFEVHTNEFYQKTTSTRHQQLSPYKHINMYQSTNAQLEARYHQTMIEKYEQILRIAQQQHTNLISKQELLEKQQKKRDAKLNTLKDQMVKLEDTLDDLKKSKDKYNQIDIKIKNGPHNQNLAIESRQNSLRSTEWATLTKQRIKDMKC